VRQGVGPVLVFVVFVVLVVLVVFRIIRLLVYESGKG
jgi:hypothetical protein